MDDHLILRSGAARVAVDLAAGGRLASVRIEGLDILGRGGPDVLGWGCYPMAPYAGRVRDAVLAVGDHTYPLPVVLPPHAAHGTTFSATWTVSERRGAASAVLECPLGPDWPYAGKAIQRLTLEPGALNLTLEVHSESESFPASCGWHPWFRRRLSRGAPVRMEVRAGAMLAKDPAGITSPVRVDVRPGPWDDCFVDVHWPVSLIWARALRLDIMAQTGVAVIFDERPDAVCVEPQSHAPNAINTDPQMVHPGQPLMLHSRWTWRKLPW